MDAKLAWSQNGVKIHPKCNRKINVFSSRNNEAFLGNTGVSWHLLGRPGVPAGASGGACRSVLGCLPERPGGVRLPQGCRGGIRVPPQAILEDFAGQPEPYFALDWTSRANCKPRFEQVP